METIMNGQKNSFQVYFKDVIWRILAAVALILFMMFAFLFVASGAQAAQVTLQWDANDPAPDGYRVFQRVAGQTYNYKAPVCDTKATQCTITGLATATLYYFVARAYVAADESGDSNEVGYKPPVAPPVNLRINFEISVYIDSSGNPVILSQNVSASGK